MCWRVFAFSDQATPNSCTDIRAPIEHRFMSYRTNTPASLIARFMGPTWGPSGADGSMMTSSNGNIFLVTGPLCGEFTGPGEFPAQRPVTRSFDVFLDLHPNKRLSKQWWDWWFETQRAHYGVTVMPGVPHVGPMNFVIWVSLHNLKFCGNGLVQRKKKCATYVISSLIC